MRKSFLNHEKTVVSALFYGTTVDDVICEARNAEFDGADGLTIELARLKPEFRNQDGLTAILNCGVKLPFMFCYYRNDAYCTDITDARRAEVLLAAAGAGASMLDVMGDLYDPAERELTFNKTAVRKQKELISRIHDAGAEVVMSSHMPVFRTAEETLAHLQEMESRGADLVKHVSTADSPLELAEAIRTTMLLKEKLTKPFIHLVNGSFSRPHRYLCAALGASVVFGITRHDPGRAGGQQPTVRAYRAVLDNFHWNINDYLL